MRLPQVGVMLTTVGGPNSARETRYVPVDGSLGHQASGKPLHPHQLPFALATPETRFLEYRLNVVEGWPPSARKKATLAAILFRMNVVNGTAV